MYLPNNLLKIDWLIEDLIKILIMFQDHFSFMRTQIIFNTVKYMFFNLMEQHIKSAKV